jgi:signal recognition particle subunit SRP54
MLEKLKDSLQSTLKKFAKSDLVDESAIKEFSKDVQRSLLQSDINVKQVFELTSKIEARALNEIPPPGLSRKDQIIKILYDELVVILGDGGDVLPSRDECNTILLMGIQGSGKTSTAAKLGRYMKQNGYDVGMIAGDTFRPGAYLQLKTLADNIGVDIFGQEKGGNSIDIIVNGVNHFKNNNKNIIIVDTTGRHKEEGDLLEEMKLVSKKIKPNYVMLVIDGTIGQASKGQASAFHESVPVGGIIVTKLDGSAKGGGSLIAASTTGSSIFFIGTGERVGDLEPFSPTRFVGRLLGMGDLQALLSHAQELENEADDLKIKRIMSGKMTIDDLYSQFEQMKKFGSLQKILEMIPGLSSNIPGKELEGLEEQIERWRYVIQSMTKNERQDPEILKSSRIKRIAVGSGTSEKEVKTMLAKHKQAKSMMKASKGRAFKEMARRFDPNG